LDRLLLLEPDNAEALVSLTQLQAERGDRAAAQASLARLRAAHPGDPRIAAVDQAIRQGSIDPAGLAEARRLAQDGRNAEAVARYQRLFRGGEPPTGLAVEYYDTLAGTESGGQAARAGLGRVLGANPNNLRAQISHAQLLTNQEQTRGGHPAVDRARADPRGRRGGRQGVAAGTGMAASRCPKYSGV
jgi:predicted Zn-dependent protease